MTTRDFVAKATEILESLYSPKFAALRKRCAQAAYEAAPKGPDAARAAVLAVELEERDGER